MQHWGTIVIVQMECVLIQLRQRSGAEYSSVHTLSQMMKRMKTRRVTLMFTVCAQKQAFTNTNSPCVSMSCYHVATASSFRKKIILKHCYIYYCVICFWISWKGFNLLWYCTFSHCVSYTLTRPHTMHVDEETDTDTVVCWDFATCLMTALHPGLWG